MARFTFDSAKQISGRGSSIWPTWWGCSSFLIIVRTIHLSQLTNYWDFFAPVLVAWTFIRDEYAKQLKSNLAPNEKDDFLILKERNHFLQEECVVCDEKCGSNHIRKSYHTFISKLRYPYQDILGQWRLRASTLMYLILNIWFCFGVFVDARHVYF